MKDATDRPYLLRRLEEASGYYGASFSNRYMNWKRHRSIEQAVGRELKRLSGSGQRAIKVLDVGCGDGAVIFRLKAFFDAAYQVHFTGIDLSALDIDFAGQRKAYFNHRDCDFILGDAIRADLGSGFFDMVICTEVIEHIAEPSQLLDQIRRLLKEGGLLILTTPHGGGGALARALHMVRRLLRPSRIRQEKLAVDAHLIHPAEKERSRFSSAGGCTGAGEEHISVKKRAAWERLFIRCGFQVQATRGTAGLLFGEPLLDQHRVLFAVCVILDAILEILPWSYLWSECLFFELRKRRVP
jgi:2-polyprenyl-3-methyl-5-hydroxy-6-metoxy-1,4-benzoquinol methylase